MTSWKLVQVRKTGKSKLSVGKHSPSPFPHPFFALTGGCYFKQCALLLPKSSCPPAHLSERRGCRRALGAYCPSVLSLRFPNRSWGSRVSISSLLSSLTVNSNGPPQVLHWTHCLLGQGCGFLCHICVDAQCSVDMFENKTDDYVSH